VVVSPLRVGAAVGALRVDESARRAMAGMSSALVTDFPLEVGRGVTLSLSRFEVLTPDAVVVEGTERGDRAAARPDVQLWRGEVWGEPGSRVFLSLSPWGASGYVRSGGVTRIVSSGPMGASAVRVFEPGAAGAELNLGEPVCGGIVDVPGAPPAVPAPAVVDASPPWTCRAFRVAIDCDYEFTQWLFGGDASASAAYVVTLLGAVSEIYQRDTNVAIQVSYLRTWTSVFDPYTATNLSAELPEFQNYWNANMGAVDRDLAHLLSGRSLGGGIAYGNVACYPGYGYAMSSHLNGFFPYPLQDHNAQNWDVNVVAHEMGHNLGSRHTHDPAQYSPPIDGCGNAYLNPPLPQDCSQAWNGTIMSYCHLCPGGETNINLTFGPRVSAAIRGYLDGAVPGCGSYPTLSIAQQPVPETVAVGASAGFSVGVNGNAPLTYQWRRDGVAMADGERVRGATGPALVIDPVQAGDAGAYDVVVGNFCGTVTSGAAGLTVGSSCYANCDGSTAEPVLNILDFSCFMARFASGDSYANCDGSTGAPTLTVNDFICFQGAFVAGRR
jgi:hypothetical protein